ncbi:MAG: hypothetical protein MJ168_04720 [Clostridia bacterium]|nr:hypothetical protein [Clostridia bacterium]
MKVSVKTALGAMCIALSTAIMLASSIIPFMIYAIPGVASLLILFMMAECNPKWALGVYFCTSAVTAMLVPEKEAVAMYIAVLGYYPLLKTLLDKIKIKPLRIAVKSLFFVAVITAAYLVMIFVFGISSEMLEETEKVFIPILYVLGLAAFLLYDRALEMFEFTYYRKWRKKLMKILKVR